MLRVPHKRCEAHKYIRVGGGYRHSYSYLKSIMGELLVELTKELYEREVQLQAIQEAREGAETPRMSLFMFQYHVSVSINKLYSVPSISH